MAKPVSAIRQTVTLEREEAEELEARAKAKALGLGYVNLKIFPIQVEVLHFLGEDAARKLRLVPYLRLGRTLRLATDLPTAEQREWLNLVAQQKKVKFQVVLASASSLNHGLELLANTEELFKKSAPEKIVISQAQIARAIKTLASLQSAIQETPTTQLLELILAGAVGTRASDVHLAPQKKGTVLRFRVDGALQIVTILSDEAYKSLASRIKYLSRMELSKKEIPQDGSFSFKFESKDLDIRVSCLPTIYGEAFVLRILEQTPQMQRLEDLGFSENIKKAILEASSKPNGLVLNTGPTASGKTTTLYAILNILNKPDKKIITVEDPIEYKLSGVVQVPVTDKITFANGLRSILRHDPDIIMVGEIRDRETAEIAIQASLTGHLVLSTLHTNNASGAFIRLLDLGIEPFLLAGNVNLVIAQRLVRRICPYCRVRIKLSEEKKLIYKNYFRLHASPADGKENPTTLFQGQGCEYCHGTGFLGRIAIAEIIKPSIKLNQLLQQNPTADVIQILAIKEGMIPMIVDGWNKVLAGITTPEEVISKTSF